MLRVFTRRAALKFELGRINILRRLSKEGRQVKNDPIFDSQAFDENGILVNEFAFMGCSLIYCKGLALHFYRARDKKFLLLWEEVYSIELRFSSAEPSGCIARLSLKNVDDVRFIVIPFHDAYLEVVPNTVLIIRN